jgi:glycosyltransferase involved in cell wall biosynthesis
MQYACPPTRYGGTQRAMAQIIACQVIRCAHDVTLYASADSAIVDFTAGVSHRLGLSSSVNETGDEISVANADGRTGTVRLKTTGYEASEDRFHPELAKRNEELLALLLGDDRRHPYDIIHSHDQKFTKNVFIPAGLVHKTLTHNHKASLKSGSGPRRYPLICISHSQARALKKKGKADIFAVVHHGMDAFTLQETSETAGYLAWLGHFGRGKGAETAIEIAKRAGKPIVLAGVLRDADADREYFESVVKPLFDRTDLTFLDRAARMSPDEIDREIASLAHEANSAPPVLFAGPAGEAQKQVLFGNAIATLFPIRRPESFGLVMIESMACGTPVIGTVEIGSLHCGAVEEVIEDGVTGFHVRGSNEEAVVERAADLVARLHELDRPTIRARFEQDWSSERLAQSLDEVYQRFLATPTPGVLRRTLQRLTGGRT